MSVYSDSSMQSSIRLQRYVAILSLLLFLIKIFAWYQTHSISILTDALESIVNVIAGFFGLYSLVLSAKPRDPEHPYGHGKVEFISAAIEGTMIVLAGLTIIWESVQQLMHPEALHRVTDGMLLLASTALINAGLGWWAGRQGKKQSSLVLMASGKHLMADALTTGGILVGLAMLQMTGWSWLDPVIALGLAGWIIWTGYQIVRQSIAGIMDEADHALIDRLMDYMDQHRQPNWIDLHNLRVIKYGTKLHIDAHLTLPWFFNMHEAHREIDALSELVRSHFGQSVELFIHTDGCLDFSCSICDIKHCEKRQTPFVKRVPWTRESVSTDEKHRAI
jgi:cation diffusion facilitator family transporter